LQAQDEANFNLEFSLYRQIILMESYSWPLAREKSGRCLKKRSGKDEAKKKGEVVWPGKPVGRENLRAI